MRPSLAVRSRRAMAELEDAAMTLIQNAEQYADALRRRASMMSYRKEILSDARRYASAINKLARLK